MIWVSLKGKEQSNNKKSITIEIPKNNILTKAKLLEIMQKIAEEDL